MRACVRSILVVMVLGSASAGLAQQSDAGVAPEPDAGSSAEKQADDKHPRLVKPAGNREDNEQLGGEPSLTESKPDPSSQVDGENASETGESPCNLDCIEAQYKVEYTKEQQKKGTLEVARETGSLGGDLEDDGSSTELPATAPALSATAPAPAAASRSSARSRRTKTRLIGFEKSDGEVVDLFNDAPKATPTKHVKFPVGWIVVADGPGRGASFSLLAGMSQIGRGEDQAIQLDFGDNAISRTNHAAIVFDPDSKEFLLGHGGKSNIVRLNDKPLISNEALKTGDIVRIGETVLRFVALCDASFNWSEGSSGEDEDVAIA